MTKWIQNELPLYPNRSVVFCGFLYKTDRHTIAEILLKVVLSTIKPNHCNLCLDCPFVFFFIVTTFILIHDTLYTILHYMGTYYCEL